jgi:hypothetical protein
MTKMRTALVGLTAASLLGLPAAALASGPTAAVHPATARHVTSIRWMAFGHIHAAGSPMTLLGQVTSTAHGRHGALASVQVKLYRQLGANPNWVYLGAQRTGSGQVPRFRFVTESRQNANYKVVFAGNASFAPTGRVTWLEVYRLFNGKIHDGSGAATYQGNVTPAYAHKSITLQKRSCATCSYVDYKTGTTGLGGAFSFSLPAPPRARWWWRVTVPGNAGFIRSYGGTITTQLH